MSYIIGNFNYTPKENRGEKFIKESKTIPDQAYTIKEILVRYRDGIPLNLDSSYDYDDAFGEELNPLRDPDMDLVDLHELREKAQKTLSEYEQYNVVKSKRKKVEDRNKAIEKEIARRLAEKEVGE